MVMPLMPMPEVPPPVGSEPEMWKSWAHRLERDKQWCSYAEKVLRRGSRVGRRQGAIVVLLAVSIAYLVGWMM